MNAVTLNGKLIGGAGIHPQEMNLKYNAEIGYWLGQEYWGNGYATEVVQQLISIAKESKKFHKLFARTFEGNLASEKVLIKNGFVHEGTLKEHIFKRGKFLNEKIWGLIL
jgi:RimJ/RimL family protein N-acetyltransferase